MALGRRGNTIKTVFPRMALLCCDGLFAAGIINLFIFSMPLTPTIRLSLFLFCIFGTLILFLTISGELSNGESKKIDFGKSGRTGKLLLLTLSPFSLLRLKRQGLDKEADRLTPTIAGCLLFLFFAVALVFGPFKEEWGTYGMDRFDEITVEYLRESQTRAALWFATSRVLNATISVIKESSVTVNIVVAGGDIALGQLLDPIDDLVEKFSNIMLISTASLYILDLIHRISSNIFSILLAASALFSFFALLFRLSVPTIPYASRFMFGAAKGVFALALIGRFYVPFTGLSSQLVRDHYLKAPFEAAEVQIQDFKDEIEPLQSDNGKNIAALAKELLNRVTGAFRSAGEWISGKTNYLVTILIIFVVETMAIPIASLWLLLRVLKFLLASHAKYTEIL